MRRRPTRRLEVAHGYASDLLSDVIANAGKDSVWVTMQIHVNIIAVAALEGRCGHRDRFESQARRRDDSHGKAEGRMRARHRDDHLRDLRQVLRRRHQGGRRMNTEETRGISRTEI